MLRDTDTAVSIYRLYHLLKHNQLAVIYSAIILQEYKGRQEVIVYSLLVGLYDYYLLSASAVKEIAYVFH